MEDNKENVIPEIMVDDYINLSETPHTLAELSRETFSVVPEKTEEELYESVGDDEYNPGKVYYFCGHIGIKYISTPPVSRAEMILFLKGDDDNPLTFNLREEFDTLLYPNPSVSEEGIDTSFKLVSKTNNGKVSKLLYMLKVRMDAGDFLHKKFVVTTEEVPEDMTNVHWIYGRVCIVEFPGEGVPFEEVLVPYTK